MFCLCLHIIFPLPVSVSVSTFPLLIRTSVILDHHTPVWSHPNQLHPQQPCFQISHVLRLLAVRTSMYELGTDAVTSKQYIAVKISDVLWGKEQMCVFFFFLTFRVKWKNWKKSNLFKMVECPPNLKILQKNCSFVLSTKTDIFFRAVSLNLKVFYSVEVESFTLRETQSKEGCWSQLPT